LYPLRLTIVLDRSVGLCLVPLALWILLNGLDDLVLDLACFWSWLAVRFSKGAQFRRPTEAELDAVPQKRIAIFVPLWNEHRVIQEMLEHNIAANRYRNYDFSFQTKDLRARKVLGGFIPSCGVGTGFKREALEKLALAHFNRIFEPECLTEDYENGFRMHRLGCTQFVIPIFKTGNSFFATREYFPRKLRGAVRQRTRWIMGNALQSWQRHGWRDTRRQIYWFWRDRKCLVGNVVTHPAKKPEISSAGMAPSRIMRQRESSSLRSTIVEATSRGEVPPSTMMLIRP